MATKHYVVQTTDPSIATTKIAVAELMEALFPTVWLATREPYTDRHRKTRIIEASLFPGYLFVEFDPSMQDWKTIPQLRGVRRILGSSPIHPTALPVGAVERLRADFNAGEFKPKVEPGIVAGERLVVIAGPFAGHVGLCELSSGERVEVMLKLLGGERPVPLRRDMVRRAVG